MRTSEETIRISAGCVWCSDRAGGCMVCGAGRIGRADKIYLHIGCHESELEDVLERLNGHYDKLKAAHIWINPRQGPTWPGVDREKEAPQPPPSDLDNLREELIRWEQHRTAYGRERAAALRAEIERYEATTESLKDLFAREAPPPCKTRRRRSRNISVPPAPRIDRPPVRQRRALPEIAGSQPG